MAPPRTGSLVWQSGRWWALVRVGHPAEDKDRPLVDLDTTNEAVAARRMGFPSNPPEPLPMTHRDPANFMPERPRGSSVGHVVVTAPVPTTSPAPTSGPPSPGLRR